MKVKVHHEKDPRPTPETTPEEEPNNLGIQRRIPGKEIALEVRHA